MRSGRWSLFFPKVIATVDLPRRHRPWAVGLPIHAGERHGRRVGVDLAQVEVELPDDPNHDLGEERGALQVKEAVEGSSELVVGASERSRVPAAHRLRRIASRARQEGVERLPGPEEVVQEEQAAKGDRSREVPSEDLGETGALEEMMEEGTGPQRFDAMLEGPGGGHGRGRAQRVKSVVGVCPPQWPRG